MDDSEKQMFRRFFRLVKMLPEILDHRAFEIKNHSYDQLEVCYSSSLVSCCIICSCKFSI